MGSVIFGSTLDMLSVATPSSGSYLVAYDLDGILKQKDEFGVITEIGGGPTAGIGGTPSFADTLQESNISGPNDILLSENQIISSTTGSAFLSFADGGIPDTFRLVSDSTTQSGIFGDSSSIQMYNTVNGGYAYVDSENIQINGEELLELGIAGGYNIQALANSTQSTVSSGLLKRSLYINAVDATFDTGVYNSVIIGGTGLSASQSNYVYLGNYVNINNAYTLPNIDGSNGESLITDGLGNLAWSSPTVTVGLPGVLSVDNDSGTYSIIMGTSTSILSKLGGQINIDYGSTSSVLISTDNSTFTKSYISLDNSDIIIDASESLTIGATAVSILTDNLEGFVYGFDYSSTFVNNSLITKLYVDNGTASIWNEINNINNDYITEVIGGVGLTGGGTAGVVTLDVNLETNSGLTFSGDDITLELNSNSLEVDSNNQIRLKDTVVGNRTFADSVIISGDLTVSGTATYVNTEDLYVADNIITLNATYSTGTPFLDAGIHVLRGSSQSSSIIWDETLEYWRVGLSGSESTIITEAGEGLLKSNNELSVDFGTVSSISYVDSQVSNYLPLAGGTMSGDIAMSSGTFIKADGGDTNLSLEPTYWQIDNKTGTSSYTESWIYGDDRSVGIGVGNSTISDIYASDNGISLISHTYGTKILMQLGSILIEDNTNLKGAIYGADYSANFTLRSLVDKGYVDGGTSSLWAAIESSNELSEVLSNGNITGTNSIIMSNDTTIVAATGSTSSTGVLNLRYNSNDGEIFLGNNPGSWNEQLYMTDGYIELSSYDNSNAIVSLWTDSTSLEIDNANQRLYWDGGDNALRVDSNFAWLTIGGYAAFRAYAAGAGSIIGRSTFIATRNDVTTSTTDQIDNYPALISSRKTSVDVGVVNSVSLGGVGMNMKTDGTAYVNQIGFTRTLFEAFPNAYEVIVQSPIPTADRLQTIQDKDGIIALTTDLDSYLPLSGGTVSGDLAISGDLIISGTQTVINTENLYVEDNIITLNATYSGPPIIDSGIEVNHGDGTYSKVLWDAGTGYWQVGLSGSESTIITEAGDGLIKSNNQLEVDFGTVSSIDYVDNGTASIWLAISDYIAGITAGAGLTGGGTAGYVTLDANVNNGLSITSDYIGLGGTLSQNTTINGQGYDITLGDIGYMLFTSSVFDIESDFVSLDSGTGSTQILSGTDTTLVAGGDLDLLATNGVYVVGSSFSVNSIEIDPTSATNGQALVYDGVKFSPSTLSGDIAGITAGAGLTGGGSSGYVTLDANVNNGLSITSDYIGLGGSLINNTQIEVSGFDITLNGNFGSGITIDATNGEIEFYNGNLGSPRGTIIGIVGGTSQTWTMPSTKTGTVALTSDITTTVAGYLPLSGGTMSADAFISGSSSLNLVSGNIFIDETNNRVGINTTTPYTISPSYPSSIYAPQLIIVTGESRYGWSHTDTDVEIATYIAGTSSPNQYGAGIGTLTSHDLQIMVGDVYITRFDTSGNVGIGNENDTASLSEKLQVFGDIWSDGSYKIYDSLNTQTGTLQSSISGSDKTWTLPNATGTIALTSDIPTVSGTTDTFPIFTGTSSIGDSNLIMSGLGDQILQWSASGPQFNLIDGSTNFTLSSLAAANGGMLAYNNGTFIGRLRFDTNPGVAFTANQDWDLPDQSGTIALTSDITGTNKESDIRNFTASVVETITHTLNTEDLIIQTYDSNPDSLTFGVQIIPDTIQITGTSSVDITLSQTLSSIKTIIIG